MLGSGVVHCYYRDERTNVPQEAAYLMSFDGIPEPGANINNSATVVTNNVKCLGSIFMAPWSTNIGDSRWFSYSLNNSEEKLWTGIWLCGSNSGKTLYRIIRITEYFIELK